MHNFKELKIWKAGMEMSKQIFQITRAFPLEERYSLSSQMNRCAIAIPSNIAEGSGRSSKKEFSHFLSISLGSAFELETQVILASEFGYLAKPVFETTTIQINEIQKMISGLHKSLNSQS